MSFVVPAAFAADLADRAAEPWVSGAEWLRSVPAIIDDALDHYEVRWSGGVWFGACALVLPVLRRDESPAVLKVTWPHAEARDEHLALRAWQGDGAVRLLAAEPARWTMVLERLDGDCDLRSLAVFDACQVISGLLRRLDRPAPPAIPTLTPWVDRFLRESAHTESVPRRYVDQARSLAADLLASSPRRLVHSDLHYDNVLAADREPWLAIDPKPVSGDPAFAIAPALWNRWDDAATAHNPVVHLQSRLSVLCESAGIDEDRARGWTIVREVQNAIWAADHRPRVSRAVTLVKAMQR